MDIGTARRTNDQGTEYASTTMARYTKGIGKRMSSMEKVDSYPSVAHFMKVTSSMVKSMALVSLCTQTILFMMVSGTEISIMVKALKHLRMAQTTEVSFDWARELVRANMYLLT